MLPLFRDPGYTFRFAEDRIISRFHLEGAPEGRPVIVYRVDPETGARNEVLARARTGAGGWVEVSEPIRVRAGDVFVAVPGSEG